MTQHAIASETGPDLTTLVYIVGRGHSGSTILDVLLGNAGEIESVGELVAGLGRSGEKCACGEDVAVCSYWAAVREVTESESGQNWDSAIRAMKAAAHVSHLPATIVRSKTSSSVAELRTATAAIARGISAASGKRIVLDSSKEVTRALFLLRSFEGVRVIHLVRDPRSIMASNLKRVRAGEGFTFLRRKYRSRRMEFAYQFITAISWFIGNMLAEAMRLFSAGRVLRVRYEDLTTAPKTELGRIADFVGADLTGVGRIIENGGWLEVGHNVGGNRLRHQQKIQFMSGRAGPVALPGTYQLLASVCCWPLMLRYGYSLVPESGDMTVATNG